MRKAGEDFRSGWCETADNGGGCFGSRGGGRRLIVGWILVVRAWGWETRTCGRSIGAPNVRAASKDAQTCTYGRSWIDATQDVRQIYLRCYTCGHYRDKKSATCYRIKPYCVASSQLYTRNRKWKHRTTPTCYGLCTLHSPLVSSTRSWFYRERNCGCRRARRQSLSLATSLTSKASCTRPSRGSPGYTAPSYPSSSGPPPPWSPRPPRAPATCCTSTTTSWPGGPWPTPRALGNHERSIIWLPSTSPLWKRLRAVCTNHLFSAHGLDAARAVRERKVRDLVGCIRGHAGEAVDVGRVVLSGLFNIVSSVLFSEEVGDLSSDRAQGLEKLIDDILVEFAKPNLSDLFPVLSVLDLQGRRRRTVECLTRFFDFLDPIIGRRMKAGGESTKGDFLDVLLQLQSADQPSNQTVKSFLLDLFVAGTETNAQSVEWTMAELLGHPAVMSKVRAELQQVLGSKQYPDESDIIRLSYLRAVLMESMRLHPPSPLLMPHEAMAEGAEVGGFLVPEGAMVIVNLWAVMRDPATWTEPEAFMPERFVGVDMDFRGKDRFEFMPFGAGRRICPGMPMTTRIVTLILASLLHRIEWRLPEGMQPCDVDIRDWYRTSLNMVTPLKAVPLPLFP